MSVRREGGARRVSNNGRCASNLVTDAVKHSALDTRHWRLHPVRRSSMDRGTLGEVGVDPHDRYCSQCFAFMLAPSPHLSGRGFGPRRSGGTLQLSTRCSSLALPPSRSLAVRIGWMWLASPFARSVTPGAASATSRMSVDVPRWARARNIIRGGLAIGRPFQLFIPQRVPTTTYRLAGTRNGHRLTTKRRLPF